MAITEKDIRIEIDKLKPYKLYGYKEQIKRVEDIIPGDVELIEVPKGYLPDNDKMILVDIRVCKP